MIDAGYNYDRLEEKMGWLGVDPGAIRHIFHAHGELCDDEGDEVQHLTAGRNGGKPRSRTKAPDDQQIDGAVGRLQDQGSEHREHGPGQLLQNAALRKISIQA
ncbi:hypothetical protein [Pseudoflavonifractor sp. MSJ-37]|uniref:hypothetical protein n=1 Tax=Pseudoflavonifractor sp. MSJ-37 TaxID=2841531 RepID=UPI0035303C64